MARRRRKFWRRAPERYNYDAADGLYINRINKFNGVSSRAWDVDMMGDPNMTHYSLGLAVAKKAGPLQKVVKINRFKQSRVNGYKGKVNGEEY